MKHTEFGHSISFIAQNWDKYPDINPNDQTIKNIVKNTWESWNLISSSRPTLPHPKQKTKIIDGLPNINGNIDLTLKDIKYPLFENREGKFEFIYNPIYSFDKNNYKDWMALYSEISNYIHGRQLRMILEDDPEYYYDGSFTVDGWTSNTDGSGSTISIGYSVYPYKKNICSSIQSWFWDPFNFYNGIIPTGVFDSIDGDGISLSMDNWNNFSGANKKNIHPNNPYILGPNGDSRWHSIKLFNEQLMQGYAGTDPLIPIIWWCPLDTSDDNHQKLLINYVNETYDINYSSKSNPYKFYSPNQILNTTTDAVTLIEKNKDSDGRYWYKFKDNDLIFCDAYCGEEQYISLMGYGKFKIEFRRGSL